MRDVVTTLQEAMVSVVENKVADIHTDEGEFRSLEDLVPVKRDAKTQTWRIEPDEMFSM